MILRMTSAHLVGINHEDIVKAIILVAFPGSAVAALTAETASSFVIST
nr:hypothetical protein [Bacillus sp. B1-b2]